jgi:hypothetical protein
MSQQSGQDFLTQYGQYLLQHASRQGYGYAPPGQGPPPGDPIGREQGPVGPQGEGTGAAGGWGSPMGGTYSVNGNGPLESWAHRYQQGTDSGWGRAAGQVANYATGGLSGKLSGLLARGYDPTREGQTFQAPIPGSVTNGGWGDTFQGDAANFWANLGQNVGGGGQGLWGNYGGPGGGFNATQDSSAIFSGTASPWSWGNLY